MHHIFMLIMSQILRTERIADWIKEYEMTAKLPDTAINPTIEYIHYLRDCKNPFSEIIHSLYHSSVTNSSSL